MTPETILEKAEKTGVAISVNRVGQIKAVGEQKRVNQLVPFIRVHKTELIEFLQRKTDDEPVRPFIIGGELRIPLGCSPEYLYWKGGQSIFDTLLELSASSDLIENYISPLGTPEAWARWEHIKESRKENYGQDKP